jgi:ribosome recycling factor
MYKEVIKKIKPELEKAITYFKGELEKIHTGRPAISLLSDLKVDYFGQTFLLKELGSLSLNEEGQVIVQVWDKSYIPSIEKAISDSKLGFSFNVKENTIFLSLPPITSEYREKILRIISEKKEATRETIRKWRDSAWRQIQDLFYEKKITEDEKYKAKDELQDLVDEYNEKIDEYTERKIKEIKG